MATSHSESGTGRFRLRHERFEHRGFRLTIELPVSSEELIDESEFERDERLPYWAELWPAARALAKHLVEVPAEALPARAIELGCGLALPSIVLRLRGVDAVASDYDDDSLLFARHNARLNGAGDLPVTSIDWRRLPAGLERFPLVLASDVLYERRNDESLAEILPRIVADGGEVLIADPGRAHRPSFLRRMASLGWSIEDLPDRHEAAPARDDLRIRVRIHRLRPPG